ncbi:MAG: hypothetical protein VKJ24_05260, partial [Synechococcales bacterium]|nr:hypothetical protein [Synechococcales bacterium]
WVLWTENETTQLPQDGILWWSGRKLSGRQRQQKPPWKRLKGAIAYGRLNLEMGKTLENQQVPTYAMQQSGAIQWTPEQGFIPTRDSGEAETARL